MLGPEYVVKYIMHYLFMEYLTCRTWIAGIVAPLGIQPLPRDSMRDELMASDFSDFSRSAAIKSPPGDSWEVETGGGNEACRPTSFIPLNLILVTAPLKSESSFCV